MEETGGIMEETGGSMEETGDSMDETGDSMEKHGGSMVKHGEINTITTFYHYSPLFWQSIFVVCLFNQS